MEVARSKIEGRVEQKQMHLAVRNERRLMMFTGRSNPELAKAIASQLQVNLGPITLKTFSCGEVYCRYETSIRDADVFLVQPMCGNSVTGVSSNDALMELLVMIDAAVGASAHRVIVVSPWYGYSRQDKTSASREPISSRLVARMLESAGADRVLVMDLHAGQVQGMFKIPVDHMTATVMLSQYFSNLNLAGELVVVAPDVGSVKLNKKFAHRLGAGLAILDKERPKQQAAKVNNVIGDVTGKTAIMVDDMVDTAGTLCAGANAILEAGAKQVYAACTHPVFSGPALKNLASAPFKKIVVTDTIPLPQGAPKNIHVVSCANLLAETIRAIFVGGSVSDVFDGLNNSF